MYGARKGAGGMSPPPKLLCLHYLTPKNGGPWVRCDKELGHDRPPNGTKHYDSKHDQEWE